MKDESNLHSVAFVRTTIGDVPYFLADRYEIKDGLLIFLNGLKEVNYFNFNFIIDFSFGMR
jgi:hypothetical protein